MPIDNGSAFWNTHRPGTSGHAMWVMGKLSSSTQAWIRAQNSATRAKIFDAARHNSAANIDKFVRGLRSNMASSKRAAQGQPNMPNRGTPEYGWWVLSQIGASNQQWISGRPAHEQQQIMNAAMNSSPQNISNFIRGIQNNEKAAAMQGNAPGGNPINTALQVFAQWHPESQAYLQSLPEDQKQAWINAAASGQHTPSNLEQFMLNAAQQAGTLPEAAALNLPMPPSGGGGGGGGGGGTTVEYLSGATSPAAAGASAAAAAKPPAPIGHLGGTVYRFGGSAIIVFRLGNGLTMWYEQAEGAPLPGGVNLTDPNQLKNLQAELNAGVKGGNSEELRSVQTNYTSYQDFWNTILDQAFTKNNPARNDKDVLKVILKKAARPDMSDQELANLLKNTSYFSKMTDQQRIWNDMSKAQQDQEVAQVSAGLVDEWLAAVGVAPSVTDPRIRQLALDIASGKRTLEGVIGSTIRKEAEKNPESPWMRKLRTERENQLRRPNEIENKQAEVRASLVEWGLKWADKDIVRWATQLTDLNKSEDDFIEAVKNQAQVMFPWKDRDMSTNEAAQPWLQTMNRVMEKQVNLFDPEVQEALQSGTSVYEFEQNLKKQDAWQQTKNYKDSASTALGALGRQMGFDT